MVSECREASMQSTNLAMVVEKENGLFNAPASPFTTMGNLGGTLSSADQDQAQIGITKKKLYYTVEVKGCR
jgi:hypothetical protein